MGKPFSPAASLLPAIIGALVATATAPIVSALSPVPVGDQVMVQNQGQPGLHLRHCNFQLYAFADYSPPQQDFNWTIAPALNGAAGAVSFRSVNFPAL